MQKNNGTTPKHVTLKNKFDKTKKGQKPSVIQPPTSNPSKSSLPPPTNKIPQQLHSHWGTSMLFSPTACLSLAGLRHQEVTP